MSKKLGAQRPCLQKWASITPIKKTINSEENYAYYRTLDEMEYVETIYSLVQAIMVDSASLITSDKRLPGLTFKIQCKRAKRLQSINMNDKRKAGCDRTILFNSSDSWPQQMPVK